MDEDFSRFYEDVVCTTCEKTFNRKILRRTRVLEKMGVKVDECHPCWIADMAKRRPKMTAEETDRFYEEWRKEDELNNFLAEEGWKNKMRRDPDFRQKQEEKLQKRLAGKEKVVVQQQVMEVREQMEYASQSRGFPVRLCPRCREVKPMIEKKKSGSATQ